VALLGAAAAQAQQPQRPANPPAAGQPDARPTIAVLDFSIGATIGQDPDDYQALRRGLAGMTISELAANPAVRVTFSASGTRAFTYSSQVSAPQGDPEDWVAFTPYAINGTEARLVFSLTCSGNSALTVEIMTGGSLVSGWGTLTCGDLDKNVLLPVGQVYLIRLAPAPGDGLRLVDYILTVQNNP
jgi:hypothetical protein